MRAVLRHLDWQMIMFVAGPLIQDYLFIKHLPKIYYLDIAADDNSDRPKAA